MCRIETLSRKGQTVVCRCVDCGALNVWHQNLLLNFEPGELISFKKIIAKVPFERNAQPFPDGTDRIVIRTPHFDIRFTFSLPEFQQFKAAIDEALFMQEIYALMK